ncbi:S41 family peptidase [Rhodocytophaga aerolata]|uniref:S41 family peptidase n=1 Tax=Rhodocytophaga aerolata TaxID=455078 RepID=A0ABT8R2N4_9BACT|nr:S41 family peptidase [Rhodocytophaga aerolata]MDO1446360.1 S41 family peptidase [Rhodocytophaga aerolata]
MFLAACNDLTLGPEPANTPEKNFELMWQEFDQLYGLFEVKQINWREVYNHYRPLVNSSTSDDELFDILSQMLGQLNDGHVWLLKPGPNYRRFDSGKAYPQDNFSLDVAKNYLEVANEIHSKEGIAIVYGRFPGNIGYVYFEDLGQSPSFYDKEMKQVISYLSDTKALIVDARSLEGGDDRSAQLVASIFATERTAYMTSRFRSGPKHTDFTAPIEWYINPSEKYSYTHPVILLTSRTTGSAGETFTLAMRKIAQVQHLGDTTNGIFSENPRRELPNGWIYTISVGDFRAADGKSYEGIGIAPQKVVRNTKEATDSGKDLVIETALNSF